MIPPVEMEPQKSVNFSGMKKSFSDPLDARNAYAKVIQDNKNILEKESLKFKKGVPSQNGKKVDLIG